MFLHIEHVPSGSTLLLRRHARKWAEAEGLTIAAPDGHIPAGCGDYRAETRRTKAPSPVIWDGFDFYLEAE